MMNNKKNYKAIPVRHDTVFTSDQQRPVRPWQYLLREFCRLGIQPPADMPRFDTFEAADAWLRHELVILGVIPAERQSSGYPTAV